MPKKRLPLEITEKDVEDLEKVTTELRKGAKYPEPKDNYLIMKEDKNEFSS